MGREVKGIKLNFENVTASEFLEFSDYRESAVRSLEIKDIDYRIDTVAVNYSVERFIAKSVRIELNSCADKPFDSYGVVLEGEETLFKRIMRGDDITSITVYFEDGTDREIYPVWNIDNSYCNSYQNSFLLMEDTHTGQKEFLVIDISESNGQVIEEEEVENCEDSCENEFSMTDLENTLMYREHNLLKNPKDLPESGKRIIFKHVFGESDGEHECYSGHYSKECNCFFNDDFECYITQGQYKINEVVAWRYLEPFRTEVK